MIWPAVAAFVVVVNTVASLSDWVVDFIAGPEDPAEGGSQLPRWLQVILEARPDVGDAEVHLVMWGLAAFALAMAIRRSKLLVAGVGGLLVWSFAVEWLQPVITERRAFQWLDVAGNTAGILLGAGAVLMWRYRHSLPRVTARARWGIVAVVGAVAVVSMWSVRVRDWWVRVSGTDRNPVGDLRPDVHEADVHLVVWFMVSVAVIWAIGLRAHTAGAWRRWALGLVAVFAMSWLVEALQPVVSERGYRGTDVLANAVGIALAGLSAAALAAWRRRRQPRPDALGSEKCFTQKKSLGVVGAKRNHR